MIPTNNFEVLIEDISNNFQKQIIQSNMCVSYELAESDAHAESPTQIKSPGEGQFFQWGKG